MDWLSPYIDFGQSSPHDLASEVDLSSDVISLRGIRARSILVWASCPRSSRVWAWKGGVRVGKSLTLVGEWTGGLLTWTWPILPSWASFWGWVRVRCHIFTVSFIELVCESSFTLPIPSLTKGGGGCRESIAKNLSTPLRSGWHCVHLTFPRPHMRLHRVCCCSFLCICTVESYIYMV